MHSHGSDGMRGRNGGLWQGHIADLDPSRFRMRMTQISVLPRSPNMMDVELFMGPPPAAETWRGCRIARGIVERLGSDVVRNNTETVVGGVVRDPGFEQVGHVQ